jgi:5'(3')-deoxyribonucleotidase
MIKNKKHTQIYVDMDGVLVDFFTEWTKLVGVKNWKDIQNIPEALDKIRNTKDFWINLKPTQNGKKLLNLIKKLKGEYNILSAPLADDRTVETSKRKWVENHLKEFLPKNVIITADKYKYAKNANGTPNILIDDFGKNIEKWEEFGGIGVKHKDHKLNRTKLKLSTI